MKCAEKRNSLVAGAIESSVDRLLYDRDPAVLWACGSRISAHATLLNG